MQIRLTLRDEQGRCRDVALLGPDGCRLGDLRDQLGADAERTWWSGSRRLGDVAVLGGTGLRSGDILDATPRPVAVAARDALRLHVVGGPDSGRITPLRSGQTIVGRDQPEGPCFNDPDVSRQHLALTVTEFGVRIHDLGSTNGTTVDQAALGPDPVALAPGVFVRLGDTILCVATGDEPSAALAPGPDGTRFVNRPPRLSAEQDAAVIDVPDDAGERARSRIPWITALLPALAGGGLALAMHNLVFLAFALLSPIVMLATAASDRLHGHRDGRRARRAKHAQHQLAEAQLRVAISAETTRRREAHPDPATVFRTATNHDRRLWSRRCTDADFLDVHVGTGQLPSRTSIRRGAQRESAALLPDVPVVLNLSDGPLGIAGSRVIAEQVARWIVAQLAVLHSPSELDLALLLPEGTAPSWRWLRWLPHLRGPIATTAAERQDLVNTLGRLVEQRHATHNAGSAHRWAGSWTVLIVDRCAGLTDLPGLARILEVGPAVGITAVCLDEQPRWLPAACRAVAEIAGDTGSRLRLRQAASSTALDVLADRVDDRWGETVARALAGLADPVRDGGAAIATECHLIDVLGCETLTPQDAALRWASGPSTTVRLGVGLEGPIDIDLARDGPHMLVAGTTGSGKSELLQSLIASLALANSPAAMSFVLIDYKGGAALADCTRLPHTAGLVTDLDGHLTQRALRSLDAEIRRREKLFANAGVKDLENYDRISGLPREPLGRLILVVDEFAALAEELPDFVAGLIGVAQRGRSLGIHLVLATQRPGGVVSPEITANTALRIALRVTDTAESGDVIGDPAAASIDKRTPGRAFIRRGSSLVEVQTAQVSGIRASGSQLPRLVELDSWAQLPASYEQPKGPTDLQRLAEVLRCTARDTGVPSPRSPWLPPLPARLELRALDDRPEHTALGSVEVASPTRVPLGLIDLPGEQRQSVLGVDLDAAEPILIIGSAGSGRTNALRVLAASAAARLGAGELHIHVIDCAGGTLRELAGLPQCGSIADRDDPNVIHRLLTRLGAEVSHRLASRTAPAGAGSPPEQPHPRLLLLVDGWEGFVSVAEQLPEVGEQLQRLLREGGSVGLTIAIAGDRAALSARLIGNVRHKFLLRLDERADYGLAGIPQRLLPASFAAGRAIRAADGATVQFATIAADHLAGLAEDARLAEDVRLAAGTGLAPGAGPAAGAGLQPAAHHSVRDSSMIQVRALPLRVGLRDLISGGGYAATDLRSGDAQVLIGAGGDAARAVGLDLAGADSRFLIAGPARSGRTTALELILRQATSAGLPAVVAAPTRSSLSAVAVELGAVLLTPQSDPIELPAGALLLVDDSEAFLDTRVGESMSGAARASALYAVVAVARSDEIALTYRGVAAEVRRSRTGLLLQPGRADGELLGVRLPHAFARRAPGRGVLVSASSANVACAQGAAFLDIQVALP